MSALSDINLPALNGRLEAGIAAGVDAALADKFKLPVLGTAAGPSPDARKNALACAAGLGGDFKFPWFLNGISALFESNLIRTHIVNDEIGTPTWGDPDGDWIKTDAPVAVNKSKVDYINSTLNQQSMTDALTLVIAMKANYWLINHHTGQAGRLVGYADKVWRARFGAEPGTNEIRGMHMLGHFGSTLGALDLTGVMHILKTLNLAGTESYNLNLTDDAKLRFSSLPAGTHRVVVANAAAKRLVKSAVVRFTPSIQDFLEVKITYENIEARRDLRSMN